ncbi:PKD domain-containing protein [[Eubacterium] cellulosolvens]
MTFSGPSSHGISYKRPSNRQHQARHKFTSLLVIVLLLTSMIVLILPVSDVAAQPDGFEYFVHSETSIQRKDEDMDGYFETARIYYDVDSTTIYAEIKVICKVTETNTTKVVKELSETYTIFRSIDTKETYFDFRTSYSGSFNFTLTVYDVVHNHQEYGGNDYPAGRTTLQINPYGYRIIADATAYDADADGYNDDVRIMVRDNLNFTLSNASIYIDGDYRGKTDANGQFFRFNLPRGIHEVDVFYHGLHGNTDFKSEGTGQQAIIYADADPFDDDQDGYIDDILIQAYAYNYYALPNAEVYIDGYYYGTTNQQGILYAYDFDIGFHYVFVSVRNLWTDTVFYAEAENVTDISEYFFRVWAQTVALDNDGMTNDIDIYLDVDVANGKTSNVTVNATVFFENRTIAATGSVSYTTTGAEVEDEHIYIRNLTSNLTYNIRCELFDDLGNLEDVWYIDEVVIQVAYGIINVDNYVMELNDDDHFNDVIFHAHVKDEPYTVANVKVYWDSNTTLARNLTTSLRNGFAVAENLLYANYTWKAYDNLNNEIDNGTFQLYDRNPFRTAQIRVQLFDDDDDAFFDDFEVIAYNDQNVPERNVSIQVVEVATNQLVAQGYTNFITSDRLGRFLVEDLPEGYYKYTANIVFLVGNPKTVLLGTGLIYSYGNSTESTHNLNAFAIGVDLDSDGYKNDVRVQVTDRNGQPVMNAIVFYNNDFQNSNTTDSNGVTYENDFERGWHDVDVVFLGTSSTVPPGSQAHTRFYSEGMNYDEYFFFIYGIVDMSDDDDEFNDFNVSMDVDVDEPITVRVSVEIEVHYASNDTLFANDKIEFDVYDGDWDVYNVVFHDLPYNESYYANYTLKDDYDNIEDQWNQSNIHVIPIPPVVNVELWIDQYIEENQTTFYLGFYAHIVSIGIEDINLEIYYKSNDTLATSITTDEDGIAWLDGLADSDYYYKALNNTNHLIEYGEFNLGNHPASIFEYEYDMDGDGYFDDFIYYAIKLNWTPEGWRYERVNLSVIIYNLNDEILMEGDTSYYYYIAYNLSEGFYKFKALYDTQRVTNGTFFSYGNGFENQPPVAIISEPLDGSIWNTTDNIQFDGSASSDPDTTDILSFYWESDLTGPLGYTDSFTRKLSQGVHKITLYVDDGSGHNSTDSVTLTVNKPIAPTVNQKPIANAGPDQDKAPVNMKVTLDGSGSTDPDGYIVAYNWSVVSKPSGASAVLNDSNYVKPTFTPNKIGVYKFSLGVQDNNSEWSVQEDIVSITVIENQVPVVNISSPSHMGIFNTTDKIFFLSNGTYDPDDDLNSNGVIDGSEQDNLTYTWTIWRGNVSVFELSGKNKGSFNSSSIDPALPAASYIVNLTVEDSLTANASIEVEINITNVPPVINITSPTEGEMFRKYKTAKLDASATQDADNDTADLYFYWEITPKDNTPIIYENISVVNVALDYEGEYTITLWVDDNMGTDLFDREHNVTAVVNITVENQAPIADARLEHEEKINLDDIAYFNGSRSSDPDGARDKANFTYEWDLDDTEDTDDDGNYTNDKDREGVAVNYTYENAGTYVVTLTVSDGSDFNDTAVDNVTVIINTPPVADAGADIANAMADTKLLLDGSNSSDADGDILWFTWVYDKELPDTSANTTSPYANATYELPGTYTAVLRVFDGLAWSTDELVIIVIKSNSPPFCFAGSDITNINVGQKVYFSGTNCSDDDDDELTFRWDFGDGTPELTGSEVTHTYSTNGVYTVTLNITDGEAYANDTLTVTVRPQAPRITDPDDGDTVKDTVVISGTATGQDITKVEVKIGNKQWDDATAEEDDWSVWSYSWDTTEDKNDEYKLSARVVALGGTSATRTISVNVSNAEPFTIEITSHSNNDLVKSNNAIISGTTTGEGITRVEIQISNGNWEVAEDTSGASDYSTWRYTWDTTQYDNKKSYTITVRATAGTAIAQDSLTLRLQRPEPTTTDEGDEPTDYMTWLRDNIMMVAGIVIVIIILLLILGMVSRSRSRRRRMLEEEEAARRREEERERFETLKAEKEEEERLAQIKRQPVRCPRCKEYSVIEDDGQRPLMIECVHCGANGYIGDRPKTLAEPELPKEEEKLIIQCPKCDEMFTVEEEEGEIVCPSCGVRGNLDQETIDELKKQQAEEREREGAGETVAGKSEPEKESKEGEKEPEKTGKPEKKIKCPNCDTQFTIDPDADKITCPSCGVTGSLL